MFQVEARQIHRAQVGIVPTESYSINIQFQAFCPNFALKSQFYHIQTSMGLVYYWFLFQGDVVHI